MSNKDKNGNAGKKYSQVYLLQKQILYDYYFTTLVFQ
jgi:hypothetical protein